MNLDLIILNNFSGHTPYFKPFHIILASFRISLYIQQFNHRLQRDAIVTIRNIRIIVLTKEFPN